MDELALCVVRAARLAVSVRSLVSSLWCSCVDGPVSSGASEKVCGSSSASSEDSGEGGRSRGCVSDGTGGNGTVADVVDDGGGRLSSARALTISLLRMLTSSTRRWGSGGLALSG